jgi:hypothetical protein
MKRLIIATCIISVGILSCNDSETKKEGIAATDSSAISSKTEEPMHAPVDSATMMKNWMAYSTPGEMHKMMAGWDGTWDGDITMWHAPGAPPETSKGTAVNKMIMGGRYQESIHTGNMMGMPFEGKSTMAYDNAKKTFISTWVDNMGTGIMTMEGKWDDATKSITQTGKCVDPSAGTDKEMDVRQVLKVVDDKNHVFEMYGPGPDGKEFKMMEIKMTKK